MEVKIVEESKTRLVFELTGSGHTLSNAIRKELWNDKNITVATYSIAHPLVEKPKFIVETNGSDPKKAVKDAVKRLQKTTEKFASEAKVLK